MRSESPICGDLAARTEFGSAGAFHRRSLTTARVAADAASVHTPIMTLKNAALLAFVGTIVMTVLLVWNFVFTFLNVLRDLVPAVTLFSSLILCVWFPDRDGVLLRVP